MSWATAILHVFSQETDLLVKVIMKCVNIKFWDLLGCFHYILNPPRIYKGVKLTSVYVIANTKHRLTYLALAPLFPVLVTHRFQTLKYTYYVAFSCISLRILSFLF